MAKRRRKGRLPNGSQGGMPHGVRGMRRKQNAVPNRVTAGRPAIPFP